MITSEIPIRDLADQFKAKRRIQIPGIFNEKDAQEIYRCLDKQVPWKIAYIGNSGPTTMDKEEFRRLNHGEQAQLQKEIIERAQKDFQFLYHSFMMVTAYKAGERPELMLHGLLEYLNSSNFLDVMRQITGISAIRKADAQATRYLPGHFLKCHNDTGTRTESREVAYVLNFSKNWQPDWGGLLHFFDDNKNITDTFVPRFNSLSLFRVPTNHFVSQVSSFATAPRYAITGWLRSD